MEAEASYTLAVAQEGFERFKQGIAMGQWEPFLEMLTEDCTFSVPASSYKGSNQGKTRLAQFLNYATESVFKKGLTLTLQRITYNETTVVFEVISKGEMWGKPYQNQAAIVFDIQGDRICSYREYLAIIYTLPS
ncbi:MAG: nuclear transport factor 2 family protein [Planktothrix sp.]|uniref:nuclear transport factor 2 family protein n=3 Tax=Planktothrix sp. TaxID=3088171 RepID=UPI0038D37C96